MKKTVIITCTLMVTCMSVSSSLALDKWDVIAPYALIPSIDGDTSIGRVEGGDIDVGPDDILNNLDLGGMIQLEAHHDSGFGAIVAYNFMDLSGGVTGPEGQNSLKADIEARNRFLQYHAVREQHWSKLHFPTVKVQKP